ncbi:TDT family transporter [Shewanella gelidimarina]|uniref:TDT family transporter n=1 Tax=Shewanella gelidimarina TaxID=56813 RepID=UPI00200F22F0|nr:TDT family transporter [Shewanella gelidimarina]MCL1060225.1 TDT family transporter [Shewanella gelidimarina]
MTENDQVELSTEIGPNWFASVMGTGIIANALANLPFIGKSLTNVGIAIWLLAFLMLIVMVLLKILQAIVKPHILKRQLNDPIMAQFFGAPPMALLTVAGGTILYGNHLFSEPTTLTIAWALWILGTVSGLIVSIAIPYRLFTYYEVRDDGAFGGWLMPVVPPMVSAAIGAMLIPYVANPEIQQLMLYGCYAMFGVSLFSAFIIITMIWSRLAHSGTSGGARVPTLWIVLGPLGQSITAAGALGTAALLVVEGPIADTMNNMAIIYGVPVWGFAFFWSILVSLLTLRALRNKMPFALTWWAFTFPVGTCVTGTIQLAIHTDLDVFRWAAVILFIGLFISWIVAAVGTIKGIKKGHIIKNQTVAVHAVSKKGK